MTGDQMVFVLRMLTTAYPEFHMTEPGAVLWAKSFAHFDFDDVSEAADQWVLANERFPKISQLLTEAKSVVRRRQEDETTGRVLGAAPQTPEQRNEVQRMMAVTRDLLAEMKRKQKQHWHGGPNPCEVCGGMKP